MIWGYFSTLMRSALGLFASVFLLFASVYLVYFNIAVRVDADAAESRFDVLMARDAARRAASHGERALRMRRAEGVKEEDLASLKALLARAQSAHGRHARAASLYDQALGSKWAGALDAIERAKMEDQLAHSYLWSKQLDKAVGIYAVFLDHAGDEAARQSNEEEGTPEAFYAERIESAANPFAEALKPTGSPDKIKGGPPERLAAADHMAELGAFYAMRDSGLYAAAGLLSTSYQIRRQLLGGDHQDTVRIALILGPVYAQMGRLQDAERLYLDAFHAQEKAKGSNSPDLSLYLKLLVDIYQKQGRMTEAQALFEHMRNLFRDAFGGQRYAANRIRDRRRDVDRPVSQFFVLEADYAPLDLVRASEFSIPLSKHYELDEMKVRFAVDPGQEGVREASLPVRLAQLISSCRSDTQERISLRSGYRSYATQKMLYERNGHLGRTAPPGMSEHQLGLAVDIDVNGRLMRRSDKTYQCFEENAYQYGFILSFPPGNNYLPGEDPFEPWHWRYVGVETAQLYREAGPINKPQEFLAALPCYRERAASGVAPQLSQGDLCLSETDGPMASTEKSETVYLIDLPKSAKTARKLNNKSASGRAQ